LTESVTVSDSANRQKYKYTEAQKLTFRGGLN